MQWDEQLRSYGNKKFCRTTATGLYVLTSFGSRYHSHGTNYLHECPQILYSS